LQRGRSFQKVLICLRVLSKKGLLKPKRLPEISEIFKNHRKNKMKKRQKNSGSVFALPITLSLALVSIAAILLATSFKAAPTGASGKQQGKQKPDVVRMIGATPSGDAPFTFHNTGSLNTARFDHTATLLPNGMVLVAGGGGVTGFGPSASAELYDSASGTWTATGSLNNGRQDHTATLLPNGMVLIAGGTDVNGNTSASAELYDPGSGIWTATGSLNTARFNHTATLLPNGMVLVAGGIDVSSVSASAELYESATPTPPTITSASASPNTLWPPNHKMVPVTVSVSATDNSGAMPTCQIVSVSSSEPINGLGDGNTAPVWQITGPLTVNLRAERSGKGTGRTYTIIVACTDASQSIETS
jgi:Galactose oxidase, central domain